MYAGKLVPQEKAPGGNSGRFASIIEVLVHNGVKLQKLLQIGSGISTGIMNGQILCCQTAAGEAGDHHPVLLAVGIFPAEKDGFSLLQKLVFSFPFISKSV